MSAAVELKLETAEDVADAFDGFALNPGVEMKVRQTGPGLGGTMVILFVRGQQIAVGRGRGLVNALANALEAVGDDGKELAR
jgi:hypothetical protein